MSTTGTDACCPRSIRSSTRAPPRSISYGSSAARSRTSSSSPEPSEHPGDRRLLGGVVAGPDRAGDDQPLHRAGHRDVVEAESLGLLGALAFALHVLVRRRADARPGCRVRDLEAEPAVGERQDVRDRRPDAPGVGHDDDLELEALRPVDRQQANGVAALLLRDRVRLLRAERLLTLDEANEALEVGAAQLFVGAREAGELAEVRVAAWRRRGGRERRGRSRAPRGSARRGAPAVRAPRPRGAGRSAAGTRAGAACRPRPGRPAGSARSRGRSVAVTRRPG